MLKKPAIISENESAETQNFNGMVCFFDFSGIMPAVYGMYLNPIKHRNKCHISVRKPDISVTLREISGTTTYFRVFVLLWNEHYEKMDIFYPAKFYYRNYADTGRIF